ncbi:MAG: YceI family protein [Sphingobacteriaceae bacterium]|nr:YceI family protein [Sphingobacteriaceae bacterium]
MKEIILYILIFCAVTLNAQIYSCKDGVSKFTSEAPLEMIKAQSKMTIGAIDFSNKNVAFAVALSTFEGFNSELQKEHFLENYVEASKYPKAIFKGKLIDDIDISKNGNYSVRAKGNFEIHGVSKEKIVKVKVVVKDKEIVVDSSFDVPLSDHDIKIPKIVNQKIASVIAVQLNATLKVR